MDNTPDILAAIMPLVEALEEIGAPYHIGGSVASFTTSQVKTPANYSQPD